jgi:predicted XRE-type DNA-binding protein
MIRTSQIVKALLDYGFTQTAIANAVGMPQIRVSRWAADKHVPRAADDAIALYEMAVQHGLIKPPKPHAKA